MSLDEGELTVGDPTGARVARVPQPAPPAPRRFLPAGWTTVGTRRPTGFTWVWLAIVGAGAALVYLPGVGAEFFWRDEVSSVYLSTRSIPDLFRLLANSDAG